MVDDALVFEGREAAVEFGDSREVAHGRVLVHEADVNGIREVLPEPVEDLHAFLALSRQNEVAHEDAALHTIGIIEDGTARDLAHTSYGGARRLEVVGGCAVAKSRLVRHVFEVGQEDVDESRQAFNGINGLISGGVVNDGYGKSLRLGEVKRGGDLGGEVCRRHEVECRRAALFLFEEDVGKAFFRDGDAEIFAADLVVLAEGAAHVAAREKYRSCALFASQARLFPRMKRYEADARVSASAAEAVRIVQAVRAAAARTEAAGGERCESVLYDFCRAALCCTVFLRVGGAFPFAFRRHHSRPSSFASSSMGPYFGRHHERARTALM